MKPTYAGIWGIMFIGAVCVGPVLVQAQMDPVFTYQGQLKEAGAPVTDLVYLEFSLWDALENGNQIGAPFVTWDGVNVVNGLFTVDVDAMVFGPTAFTGEPRWLQVVVTDWQYYEWVELSPRQPITPAPYALYAFDGAGGGGDSFWQGFGNDIYYTAGNVGVGEIEPAEMLDVNGTAEMNGFRLTASPATGYVLTSDGSGYGTWQPPGGGGDSLWQVGESCIFYNGGDVGIGLEEFMWPVAKLEVGGTVRMDGFRLGWSATADHVLTADANGVGTWQPAGGGGDSLWTTDDEGIHYQNDVPHHGNVGIGVASDVSSRLRVDSSGLQSIYAHNGHASAQTFAFYGEADSTMARTVFADATATSGVTVGVYGRSRSPDGYGVFGRGHGSSGDAIGVYGSTNSPDGFGGYFEGKGYFSGNVGIGITTPGSPLTVNGLIHSTTSGFKFPDGTIQDSAAAGGSSLWQQSGSDISYVAGDVGIGTTTPTEMLDVVGTVKMEGFQLTDGPGLDFVLTSDASGNGSWQPSSGGGGSLWQTNGNEIYYDTDNVGVGVSDPQSQLHVAGGQWDLAHTEGDFKIGGSTYRLKMGVATAGGGAGHCRIFAGGPSSELILGVSGQDRLAVTDTKVDVTGNLEVDGFRLTDSPTEDYVLTCDASGNGTWQESTGGGGEDFTLPLDRAVTHNGNAFKITNHGTTYATTAITGIIDNAASSEASAAYFSAVGSGTAVHAESDSSTTVYAHNSGGGKAFYGSTSGDGGGYFTSSMAGGYGVKGRASATTGINTIGGWFESGSSNGKGVYAYTAGATASSVHAEADGAESTAVKANSPWNAIVANGGVNAAKFYGDVRVYGGGRVVFHVDDDTGITAVDVLQIMGGSDLAENFDVAEQDAQPGTVVEIDPDHPGKLRIARGAYNRRVAGVISGANELDVGMVLADLPGAENSMPIALSGRVWVHGDATEQAIAPGDLLTTAERAGYAMPVRDFDRAPGAVIGKAMSKLARGETGMVLVLVNLQ